MALICTVAVLVVAVWQCTLAAVMHTTLAPNTHPPTTPDPLISEIANLKQVVEGMARQMIMQQLFVEERIRSDGVSGLKQIRRTHHGTKSYFAEVHTNGNVGGKYDNVNTARHLSIADNTYVMNGVEFRTMGMRYSLEMPSKTSRTLNAVEDIPFPDVPPSVLSKHNITEQMHEMTEYFRAFKNQDKKIKADYGKYFKPVVCYLEGTWFDMSTYLYNSWFVTDEKAKSYSSNGNSGHNAPEYAPVKIMKVVNDTPHYAHWKYRTLCHPIKTELHLYDLYMVDDLAPRFAQKKSLYDFSKTNDARFKLSRTHGRDFNADVGYAKELPAGYTGSSVLDRIMQEIPGKDNYPADLNDGSFGLTEYNAVFRNATKLNTGYYHRWYKVAQKGAMGTTVINRGYTDQFLFTAQTTQPHVAPMAYSECHYNRTIHQKQCRENIVRYSYAIPLEIVWLTPLLKWNPYNLMIYHGDPFKSPANVVTAHGRNGINNRTKAFNGVNDRHYYLTPIDFYEKHNQVAGVLDRHGQVKLVSAAGTRTILPEIKNVGSVRLRYPIMPLHHEGSAVYKQLDALKEIVMNMARNARIFEKAPTGLYVDGQTIGSRVVQTHYVTSRSTVQHPASHTHDVYIDTDMMTKLHTGKNITVYTSLNEGHMHLLKLNDVPHHGTYLNIAQCDGMKDCFDGHSHALYRH